MLIEGSQPLGDDLDRSLVGVGLSGGGRGWSGFQGRSGWCATGTAGASRRDRASCGLEEQAKVFRHVLGGAVPLRRPLRECLLADPFQFLGDRVVDLPRWASLSRGDLLDDLQEVNHPRNGLRPVSNS